MFIVWILIGIFIGLILACLFPSICIGIAWAIQYAKTGWNYLMDVISGKARE
jgi:hypothetical protein